MQNTGFLKNLGNDIPAGIVVFLVALPLCLGIALASGVPFISGIIAGVVGGLVISLVSGSSLSVSGPAAGLTAIVLSSIDVSKGGVTLSVFFAAVVLCGVFQIGLGLIRAGTIGNYFPSAVIKGMLAAIGIMLIIKQIPHAIGYDKDFEGDFSFVQPDNENSFSEVIRALNKSNLGAFVISITSLVILAIWETPVMKKIKLLPGPLVVVIFGIIFNQYIDEHYHKFTLRDEHLVQIPILTAGQSLMDLLSFPTFHL